MNPYQFHDTVVLRHPVYSFQQFNEDNLAIKLHDSFFRNAIYLCSPTVFEELKKCDFEYDKINGKLRNTLLKYFNRMCYRPTPFALCAALSTAKWSDSNQTIRLNTVTLKPDVKLSYAKSLQVATDISGTAKSPLLVKVNATLYKSGNQVRYIKSFSDGTDKIAFYLASAETTGLLNKILTLVVTPHAVEEIERLVIQKVSCPASAAAEYVQSLLKEQILVDVSAHNITGKDYLSALKENIQADGSTIGNSIYNDLKEVVDAPSFNYYLEIHRAALQKNDLYVNLVSEINDGKVNSTHQQAILDGIYCLAQVNQPHVPKNISQFVQQFSKKFEGQTIPLLYALDPEVGIGYGDLMSGSESLSFADDIAWQKAGKSSESVSWGHLQSVVLKKWMTGGRYEPIKLCTDDLTEFKRPKLAKLPSALSVIFRLTGEKVFIEQVAGVTATSLIGRFTTVNAEIDSLAQAIASHEAENNPGVIYAEIVHTCHKQTANIDRRNHIYQYEIVMLTPSRLENHFQIPLSDLYVSVQNNEVIIWSAKHGKRVIPRLSSAFNYQRDDLAAFRFLCDLQHIGVQTNFNFAIENFYPGLDFYPRIEFEQAILQCAQWHIGQDHIASVINEKDSQKRLAAFNQLRQQLQLCKYVALTQHDHQLVFDLDNVADIEFFLATVQPLKKFSIREVLTDSIQNPVLFNESDEGMAGQFIATLYHKQVVYNPVAFNLPLAKRQPIRKYGPGTEWLYFKLYSHPARTNEIVGAVLFGVVKQAFKDSLITQWFFTRYNDPDHHIRFRLKVRPDNHQKVINVFNRAVAPYQKQGLLDNVMLDTYHRELERYPDIYASEDIFHHSSNWICNYMNNAWQQLTQESCLWFAFSSTRELLQSVVLSDEERVDYLTIVINAFSNEFEHVPDLKYQLDLTYRKHKSFLTRFKGQPSLYVHKKLSALAEKNCVSLVAYFNKIHALPAQVKFKYLSDIIHMHLNRIFADKPREQEFTLYYMLLKYEKSSRYLSQVG